jgi:O-methyltransferase involved in polyketide biosynthesis
VALLKRLNIRRRGADIPRTDNDTWDLARSVGATATGVAVGRVLASQGPNALIDDPYAAQLMQNHMHQAIDRWREHGFDVDMTDLWYVGERNDVSEYLSSHGWSTVPTMMADLYAASDRSLPVDGDTDEQAYTSFAYITATRN